MLLIDDLHLEVGYPLLDVSPKYEAIQTIHIQLT